MAPLLQATGLEVHYGPVEAVRGVDFEIGEGEIVVFLGANGAGKSSTLNALVGLVPVQAGTVQFAGSDITKARAETVTPAGLTLVPEGRRVFGTLSVAENLLMGAYGIRDKAQVAAAWDRVYSLFPILHERRGQFAGTLSGGQQQMLAIGRALMSNPKLLLLDEPSLGLAPKIVEQVFDLIVTLRDQGVTLGVVEQNAMQSLAIADRGYIFAGGRIVGSGSAQDLGESSLLSGAYLDA